MQAMVLEKAGAPLLLKDVPIPTPKKGEVLIRVFTCGVCRTDLHIAKGELTPPYLPLILGHQIVGKIEMLGAEVEGLSIGMRVGVPWLHSSCQSCSFCQSTRENLCDQARFTGFDFPGGFAEFTLAKAEYVFPLPDRFSDIEAAPLLCAGLIGFRGYRLLGDVDLIGLYGFGASAHLLIQVLRALKKRVFVFTREGDKEGQEFALSLGAEKAFSSQTIPEEKLDGSLIFAPDGSLTIPALKSVKKGARVISCGIHMSDIPSFPYKLLFEERSIGSVTNLTREDGKLFFDAIASIDLKVHTRVFPLKDANLALDAIKQGGVHGSCVLQII